MDVNHVVMSVAYSGGFSTGQMSAGEWACFDVKADTEGDFSWDLVVYTEEKELIHSISKYKNELNIGKELLVIGSIHKYRSMTFIRAKEIIRCDEFITNAQAERLKPRVVDFKEGLF